MKRMLLVLLMIMMVFTVSAGGENEGADEVVTISMTTNFIGSSPMAPWWSAVKEGFLEKYDGQIELDIEEVPGRGDEQANKLQIRMAAGKVYDIEGATTSMIFDLADLDLIVNLKPYLEERPELLASLDTDILTTYNKSADEWWGLTSYQDVIGYFYNTEMFAKAGIEPAETWEGWFDNAEKLKQAGITPFSMMGIEGGWTTNLYLFNMVNSLGAGGHDFTNTIGPINFEIPEFLEALDMIKLMFQEYAPEDAIGSGAAQAGAYFEGENVAIFPNGPWYINNFRNLDRVAEGFDAKVGWSVFPGGSVIKQPGTFQAVGKNGDTQIEASMKFIDFVHGQEGQVRRLALAKSMPVDSRIDTSEVEIDPILKMIVDKAAADVKTSSIGAWSIFIVEGLTPYIQNLQLLRYNETTSAEVARLITEANMAAERNQ